MSASAAQGIVVAVDGSPTSHVAVDWAARDAQLRHLPLTLAHVASDPLIGMWPEAPLPQGFSTWRDEHSERILDDAQRIADRVATDTGAIRVERRLLTGATIPALVELSRDAAIMVVGCRGHGALKRRLLGSVSSGLVHHAHCPVAVIHDEDPLMDDPARAPILVGVDGSPASELATAIAFDQASRRRVGLIAMHAWADQGLYNFLNVDWQRQLEAGEEALAERLAGWQERYPDVPVDRRLVNGEPGAQLVEASETAQLTVVGSHGRGGFAGMLLGSVSSAVAQAARMPVIVARQS